MFIGVLLVSCKYAIRQSTLASNASKCVAVAAERGLCAAFRAHGVEQLCLGARVGVGCVG